MDVEALPCHKVIKSKHLIRRRRVSGANTKAAVVAVYIILRLAGCYTNWAHDNMWCGAKSLGKVDTGKTASGWAAASININCSGRIGSINRKRTTAA